MAISQTAVFRRIVRDHMAPPPVQVRDDTRASELVLRLRERRASAAAVVDGRGGLVGIVTEQDLMRRLDEPGQPVATLMTSPVLTVRDDDQLYRAIGFMRRRQVRHMPVVNGSGAVVGVLELHEALAVAAGPLVEEIDALTHEDSLDGLAEVKAAQIRLAGQLLTDGAPAPEIQALLADINNDIHRRVLDLLLAELGPAPVSFACIVMGSGGRGESLLSPDQDNGFVLADYPDERHGAIDPWFVALAERFVSALDGLGFALCRGGVMATSPVWRKSLSQWQAQLAHWMLGRVPETLLNCEIFFDFRHVWGEQGLTEALRRHATVTAAADHGFRMLMFGLQAQNRAGIGLFGRLQVERADSTHRGEIDLKLHGTLPLVEAVRLLALSRGIAETGTLARIDSLQADGTMSVDDADHLRSAFALLTGLQLRRQLADHRSNAATGTFVDPKGLTERELDLLRAALRAINDFRASLRADLTGSLL